MAEHDREGWQRTIENITGTPGSTSAVGTLFFAPITRYLCQWFVSGSFIIHKQSINGTQGSTSHVGTLFLASTAR